MICYFANRAFTILGMASTSLKEGLRVYDDEKVEELESGYTSFEFTVGYEDRQEAYQVCAAGNYVIRDDEEDGQDIFTIITAEDDAEKKEITLYCEDLGLDLLNEVSDEFENKTAYGVKYYLEKFMYDSGFEVRRNEIPDDTLALSFDSTETVVKRVLSVAESFGVELAYHFEISNRKITHKYVDVYKKRGQDTKQEFRLGRDLSNIKRKESIENMVSAVLARGGTPHAYHKYADTSTGGGMYDDSSQPHPYYGYITKAAANSKGYSEAPSDPSAYTWITIEQFNKIRKTIDDKYHKYADTATGGGMTDDSSWEKSYYGYTTTSTEDEAPTDPSAYTWITVEEYNETRDSDKYEAKQVTLNGVTYDDGDLYVDGGILGSRKSLYKWSRYLSENASGNVGHILGIKTFDDALTPTALLNEAKEYLEGCDEPKYTYEVEFVDFPHDLHLGDTIRIVDDEGGQYLSSRVIKISKKVSEQKWAATLGDYEILDAGISVKMEQMAESFAKALAQAQQEAESAKEAAKAASYTAGNSTDQAYVANNAAESAGTTAAAAKSTAEIANKAASTASATAAEAKTTAETASATASEAKTTATAASTTAAAAKTTAETANKTASTASTTAAEAKTTAETASETADAANTKAEEADAKASSAIKSVDVQYAQNTSSTEAPTTGWQTDAPEWKPGHYIWQRTATINANNDVSYSTALCITGVQGEAGKDAVLLMIDSTNGNLFKNSDIATILTVTVITGDLVITDSTSLKEHFGSTARLIWKIKPMGDTVWTDVESTSKQLNDEGFLFTISPTDVDTKCQFMCELDA